METLSIEFLERIIFEVPAIHCWFVGILLYILSLALIADLFMYFKNLYLFLAVDNLLQVFSELYNLAIIDPT